MTWGTAVSIVAVHLGTGVSQVVAHKAGWLEALVWSRSVPFRVAVGGQYRLAVEGGAWWRLFTSTLLHGDLLHLLVNVVALLALGRILEPWVGGRRWAAWCSAGAVAGSLASQLAQVSQSDGISGGAFALLGAAVVLGWRERHALSDEDRWLLGPVLGGFLALNLVLSFALPFVDAAGHLGGLAAGILLGALGTSGRGQRPSWGIQVAESVWLGLFCAVCALGWTGRLG